MAEAKSARVAEAVRAADGRVARDEFFYAEQNARLAEQFDAVLHFDETRAVEPLERAPHWEAGDEPPETYPTGI